MLKVSFHLFMNWLASGWWILVLWLLVIIVALIVRER